MIETPWMNRQDAAAYVGVDKRTLDRWVEAGLLVRHYPGGIRSPRYHRNDLDALMKPQTRTA